MKSKVFYTVALSFGCNDSSLPSITQEGVHVVVAADPGLDLCSASLMQMDEFVLRISKEFSVEPPSLDTRRLVLNWLVPEDFALRSSCNEAFSACARRPGTVYSKSAPFNHELVHAVAFNVGYPPSFFAEGLAVAYQGLGDQLGSVALSSFDYDVRPLIEMSGADLLLTPGGYPVAGGFTSFLIARFGIVSYLQMYASLGRQSGADEVDVVFQDEFDVSLEQAILDFEASSILLCGQAEYDAKLIECNAPELLWDGNLLEFHRSLSCDQDDSVGPFSDGTVVVSQTLSVVEDAAYELRVFGDSDPDVFSGVSLQYCGGCVLWSEYHAGVDNPPVIVQLRAGVYSIRLHGSASDTASIGLRLRRVENTQLE